MNVERILEDKKKAYNAEYYKQHLEEKKAYAHQYYLENKAKINKRNKEWASKNKAKSKFNFFREKDVLSILSSQRKNIGDNTYYLLIQELEKTEKHIFKI